MMKPDELYDAGSGAEGAEPAPPPRVFRFSGGARARGCAHGEELRGQIAAHLEKWAQECVRATGMTVEHYLTRLYGETNFFPAIKRYTPDLLEEVRGIAEGAAQPFETVLARQLSDEEPWYRRHLRYEHILGPITDAGEHCSALAAGREDGWPPLVAQNMDCPSYYAGDQIIVHVVDPGDAGSSRPPTEAFILTIPGKLSLCGLNNHGVAICCNTLSQLDYNLQGLPEDFIVRRVLQLRSLEEVREFMYAVPHASGQNYVVGDPGGICDLECSGRSVAEVPADPDTGRVAHTNHPLVNEDQGIFREALRKVEGRIDPDDEKRISLSTTERRLETLSRLMAETGVLTPESIGTVLADRTAPLCVAQSGHYTVATVVMELSRGEPRLHVAPDPSRHETRLHTLSFGQDGT